MKTNEGERLVQKTHPPSCFECKGPSQPPCIRPSFRTGSSVGNATSLALLRHSLAFTSIRRAGQRASEARSYPCLKARVARYLRNTALCNGSKDES